MRKYEDVFIYVPDTQMIICIAEGDGSNLLKEDVENGYVDYIYYTIYDMKDEFNEYDGGMIMLKELFREKYPATLSAIPDVMSFMGYETVSYLILR